jgi:hypothetical protein
VADAHLFPFTGGTGTPKPRCPRTQLAGGSRPADNATLTLVTDHRRGKIVWGAEGRSAAVCDRFFADLDPLDEPAADALVIVEPVEPDRPRVGRRAAKLEAISLDMGPGYAKSAREHAPQALICIGPYHVVQLANRALDEVRRSYWNALRDNDQTDAAKRFKDARWALLKNPEDHTTTQAKTLRKLRRAGGDVWARLTLKEALRAIFAPGLTSIDAAARSRILAPVVSSMSTQRGSGSSGSSVCMRPRKNNPCPSTSRARSPCEALKQSVCRTCGSGGGSGIPACSPAFREARTDPVYGRFRQPSSTMYWRRNGMLRSSAVYQSMPRLLGSSDSNSRVRKMRSPPAGACQAG